MIAETTRTKDVLSVGVHLEGTEAHVAHTPEALAGPRSYCYEYPPLAPSVILPRFVGEPLRAELHTPCRVRGSGLPWPEEAQVHPERGCARFPIAYAWAYTQVEDAAPWSWRADPEDEQLSKCASTDAIACAFNAAIRRTVPETTTSSVDPVLVVPDTLRESDQDRILGSRSHGVSGRLLWRPIAAAIEWVTRFGGGLSTDRLGPLGAILVLHLGVDGFEATFLELIVHEESDRRWILPARKRPRLPAYPATGIIAIERLVEQCMRDAGHAGSVEALWRQLWSTPWPTWATSCLNTVHPMDRVVTDPFKSRIGCRVTTEVLKAVWTRIAEDLMKHDETAHERFKTPLSDWRKADSRTPIAQAENGVVRWDQWRDAIRQLSEESGLPLMGAAVTGSFAGAISGGAHFGNIVLEQLIEAVPKCVLIEGEALSPKGVLARGAARFGALRAAGFPTYLDTLPQMQTLVMRQGEPAWLNLLTDDYVRGGEIWKREPDLDGLSIPADSDSLTLDVWWATENQVRRVERNLPIAAQLREKVGLRITMEPAQGNARVQVIPDNPRFLMGRQIYLDWRKHSGQPLTKEQAEDDAERTCPPIEPRRASRHRWDGGPGRAWNDPDCIGARTIIRNVLDLPGWSSVSDTLAAELREAFRAQDVMFQNERPEGCVHWTAVDSDGRPHPDAVGAHLLDELLERLDALVARSRPGDPPDNVLRILGWCSADTPHLKLYLHDLIAEDAMLDDAQLIAMGNCLRNSEDIGRFAKIMLGNMRNDVPRAPNYWMRALARMLQYRQDATLHISSDCCADLAQHCQRILDNEMHAKQKFRNASLCIVYLLRRRCFDDGYFDPQAEQSESIKRSFQRSIEQIKSGRMEAQGGFVDLPAVLKKMIEYIDRRGHGRLGMTST